MFSTKKFLGFWLNYNKTIIKRQQENNERAVKLIDWSAYESNEEEAGGQAST